MCAAAPPILDLSRDSPREFFEKLGELVRMSLQRSGTCILVSKGTHEVTILDPAILDDVHAEHIATALLSSGWTDEEVLAYLEARQRRIDAG